jgi:hypothetical protein
MKWRSLLIAYCLIRLIKVYNYLILVRLIDPDYNIITDKNEKEFREPPSKQSNCLSLEERVRLSTIIKEADLNKLIEYLNKEIPYMLLKDRIDIINADRKAYNKINQYLNK